MKQDGLRSGMQDGKGLSRHLRTIAADKTQDQTVVSRQIPREMDPSAG